MRSTALVDSYSSLKETREDSPLWKLLASNTCCLTLSLLQHVFSEPTEAVTNSVTLKLIEEGLLKLKTLGEEQSINELSIDRDPKGVLRDWINAGWVKRTLPDDATEEFFSLTNAAIQSLQFIENIQKPQIRASDTRLANIYNNAVQLNEATNTDVKARINLLEEERDRIQAKIDRLREQKELDEVSVLSSGLALQKLRELLDEQRKVVQDLTFVEERFVEINRAIIRNLFVRVSKGEVINHMFVQLDSIKTSPEGETFFSFWSLVKDSEEKKRFINAMEAILSRSFAKSLSTEERDSLRNFHSRLLARSRQVDATFNRLTNTIQRFVRQGTYHDRCRVQQQCSDILAQVADLAARGRKLPLNFMTPVRLNCPKIAFFSPLGLKLNVNDSQNEVVAEAPKFDPIDLTSYADENIPEADIHELIREVIEVTSERGQASIGDVLQRYPAQNGLDTYVKLHDLIEIAGMQSPNELEVISWQRTTYNDHRYCVTTVRKEYFLEEKLDALRHYNNHNFE